MDTKPPPIQLTLSHTSNCLTDNDWGILNLFRTLPSHLIQEFKQMKYEYRFFVFNGVLISGAGCVEEHTPLVNTKQFNTLMEEYRNETVIEDCPPNCRKIY